MSSQSQEISPKQEQKVVGKVEAPAKKPLPLRLTRDLFLFTADFLQQNDLPSLAQTCSEMRALCSLGLVGSPSPGLLAIKRLRLKARKFTVEQATALFTRVPGLTALDCSLRLPAASIETLANNSHRLRSLILLTDSPSLEIVKAAKQWPQLETLCLLVVVFIDHSQCTHGHLGCTDVRNKKPVLSQDLSMPQLRSLMLVGLQLPAHASAMLKLTPNLHTLVICVYSVPEELVEMRSLTALTLIVTADNWRVLARCSKLRRLDLRACSPSGRFVAPTIEDLGINTALRPNHAHSFPNIKRLRLSDFSHTGQGLRLGGDNYLAENMNFPLLTSIAMTCNRDKTIEMLIDTLMSPACVPKLTELAVTFQGILKVDAKVRVTVNDQPLATSLDCD